MNIYDCLRRKTGKVLPRRFHCYCLGAAKTATTTVSAMFEHNYDSQHEADISNTNHTIIRYLNNDITEQEILDFLQQRDRDLNLELESTHSLIYVAKQLVQLFPEAKFLVTVREPMSWLRSRLNFHFKKRPPEWEEYRQHFWMDNAKHYQPEERLLEGNGLAPLEVYLKQYGEHYVLVEKEIPHDRLLILRTDELSNKSHQIAEFLNINANKLITEHSNSEPIKAAFIDQLDEQFIIRSLWEHCAPIIEQFFPERLPYYQKHIGINN